MRHLTATSTAVAAALLLAASSLALAQTAAPVVMADEADSPMTPGAGAVPLTSARTPLDGDSGSAATSGQSNAGSAMNGESATTSETPNSESDGNHQE